MFNRIKYDESSGICSFEINGRVRAFQGLNLDKPWEFAAGIAVILRGIEPEVNEIASKIEGLDDFNRWLDADNELTEVMQDAYWHATQKFNSRDHVAQIHRFDLIRSAIDIQKSNVNKLN